MEYPLGNLTRNHTVSSRRQSESVHLTDLLNLSHPPVLSSSSPIQLPCIPHCPVNLPLEEELVLKKPAELSISIIPYSLASNMLKPVKAIRTVLSDEKKKRRKRRKKKKKVPIPNETKSLQNIVEQDEDDIDVSNDSFCDNDSDSTLAVVDGSAEMPELLWGETFSGNDPDEGIELIKVEPFLPLELPPDLPKLDWENDTLPTNHDRNSMIRPSDINGEDIIGCRVCHGTFFNRWEELVQHLQTSEHQARQEANVMVMRAIAEQMLNLQSLHSGKKDETKEE